KSHRFPPGPFSWPIVGNLLILGKSPQIKLANLAKQYGPLMYLQLGSFQKNQDDVFQYRPPLLLVKIVGNNWTFGIISGSTWRFVKRLCSNELFTMKQLQSFQPLRMKEIQETIKEIYMEAQEGKVVDVNTKLTSFSTNHMTQILFGKRLQIQVSSFIPKIIDEHRNAPLTTNPSIHERAKDFVDVLVATRGENGIGMYSHIYTNDYNRNSLKICSIVGTLEWAMAELLLQPNIMKHAQKELDNLVGTNRLVEESDLQDLPYIQAILKETFRLHPPAPFLVPHHSIEPCQVQGYTIPAKTRVIVNVWAIGRDPNPWENPLKFDPDRFMKHPEIDVQGQDFSLLPFGSGRRGCPGRSFGMLVVQIMLARLLQSFDWSLPNNRHDLDMSERFGLDLKKAEALCAMAHPRMPSHFYH
ncbi:hypothetical protein CY35_03G058600, partial [Sphagnum magellanicum]